MSDDKNNRSHNVIMENRKNLSVSGVSDVGSFDEQTIVINTAMGELTVKGSELHIERLNTDVGEVAVTGNIYGFMYTDEREKSGFFAKLFR